MTYLKQKGIDGVEREVYQRPAPLPRPPMIHTDLGNEMLDTLRLVQKYGTTGEATKKIRGLLINGDYIVAPSGGAFVLTEKGREELASLEKRAAT